MLFWWMSMKWMVIDSYNPRTNQVIEVMILTNQDIKRDGFGPALSTRGNLVPWSGPVARVHPQTVKQCYIPYLGCYETPKMMAME